MITKEDLARFIVEVAEGSYSPADWEKIAVNHFSDEEMENARRELVRYALGYPPPQNQEHLTLRELLLPLAAKLRGMR